MTAQDKAALIDRLTAAAAAVATLPDTIPPIEDLHVHAPLRVTLGFAYNFHRTWATARELAQLATAVQATVSISRSGSRLYLAVEFRHNDINFFASDNLLSASDVRTLAKALGRKAPTTAAPDPLVFTAAELLKAINTLESA